MELQSCDVQRRSDGVVLVRVHSSARNGQCLPDAVFAFRQGDPQYEYWNGICKPPPLKIEEASGPMGQ